MVKRLFRLDRSQIPTYLLIVFSVLMVVGFMVLSNTLVRELATEERKKVETWAKATELLVKDSDASDLTMDLISYILESNTTIPIILCDTADQVLGHNNIILPASGGDRALVERLNTLKAMNRTIVIQVDAETCQYLYYDDSTLLKKLLYYPYLQLAVMVLFVVLLVWLITTSKQSEQNRVWAGLSKETAHQLGTPISSLMAWIELLAMDEAKYEMVEEMGKDITRLNTIAERFSKIGSQPEMTPQEITGVIRRAVDYMSRRVSSKVLMVVDFEVSPIVMRISVPLIEWVVENLCKNAVDAMEGCGEIRIVVRPLGEILYIDISDTGRGIPKDKYKSVFKAGYTSKKRGWGLGLTLVRRIVKDYHNGNVYVLRSEVGRGTTFRIELPIE